MKKGSWKNEILNYSKNNCGLGHLIESMMGLRPRQGNLRLFFQII